MKLTIYFDGSFWCGLVEAESDGHYQVIRYVFGAEPKDADVLEFIANCLPRLLEQSGTVAAERKSEKKMNPKRIQRLINRENGSRSFPRKPSLRSVNYVNRQKRRTKRKSVKKKPTMPKLVFSRSKPRNVKSIKDIKTVS